MGKVIGVIAIKGGVGKTSVSSSLATYLANKQGQKVLLIDANYSAPNLGLHMDIVKPDKTIHDVLAGKAHMNHAVHRKFGVDIVPGSYIYHKKVNPLSLRTRLAGVKERYDYVIIDSSPALNEEILSTILASDALFVVTTPDYPTLSCSLKAAKVAKLRGKTVSGIIINKIRNPKYELDLDDIEKTTGIPVVARILDDNANVKALFKRTPVTAYDSHSNFSKEIAKLGNAIVGAPQKVSIFRKLFGLKKEEVNRQLLKQNLYKSVFEKEEVEEKDLISKMEEISNGR